MKRFLLLTALFFIPILIFADSLEDIIYNYIYTQKWSDAAKELNKYLYKNPQNHEAFALLSSVESEQGNQTAAIQAMRKAISYVTNDEKKSEYYYNLSIIYYRQNMAEAGIECNLIANKLNPTLPNPYYMNGIMLYHKDRLEEALNSWKKFLIYSNNQELNEKINQVTSLLEEYLSKQKTQEEKENLEKQLSLIVPPPLPNGQSGSSSGNNSASGQNGSSSDSNSANGQNGSSSGSNSASGQSGTSSGSNSASGQNGTSSGSNSASGQSGTSTGSNSASGQNGSSTGNNSASGQSSTSSGSNYADEQDEDIFDDYDDDLSDIDSNDKKLSKNELRKLARENKRKEREKVRAERKRKREEARKKLMESLSNDRKNKKNKTNSFNDYQTFTPTEDDEEFELID